MPAGHVEFAVQNLLGLDIIPRFSTTQALLNTPAKYWTPTAPKNAKVTKRMPTVRPVTGKLEVSLLGLSQLLQLTLIISVGIRLEYLASIY